MKFNKIALICVVTTSGILTTSVKALIISLLMSIKSLASLGVVVYSGAAVFNKSY
jgi:hypothetical protein